MNGNQNHNYSPQHSGRLDYSSEQKHIPNNIGSPLPLPPVWPWFNQPPPPPPNKDLKSMGNNNINTQYMDLYKTLPPPSNNFSNAWKSENNLNNAHVTYTIGSSQNKNTNKNMYNSWGSENQRNNNNLNSPMHVQQSSNYSPLYPSGVSTHNSPNRTSFSSHFNQNFYSPNSYNNNQQRLYFNRNRFPSNRPFRRGPYSRWHRDSNDTSEPQTRTQKKKKKPLSQNNPTKKDWTLDDVINALSIEKEFNKKSKDHSLIIKFPDHELNKMIVAGFHPSIESVHFQQPSTPRFCFVNLKESADADAVIAELNKQKFGDGYITAEYKREKEDEQSTNPEDIDPLALYVGNLAQEITKDDMVNLYPCSKRIDIGYAKKMKYTRYAFVRFRTAKDALEAFKNTHNKQVYNKTLIVRFRRFNGPVGMPGEPKPQANTSKSSLKIDISKEDFDLPKEEEKEVKPKLEEGKDNLGKSVFADLWKNAEENVSEPFVPIIIKKEPRSDSEEDEPGLKPIVREFTTSIAGGSIDDFFSKLRPIQIKTEIKKEINEDEQGKRELENTFVKNSDFSTMIKEKEIMIEQKHDVDIKTESETYEEPQINYSTNDSEDDESDPFTPNFSAAYNNMVSIGQQLKNL